jgi:ABC-2 type transport system permease protein
MRPGPGSVPWLLRHELRLGWRAVRGRTGLVWLIVLAVFSLTLIHLAAVPLAWMHSETPLIGPDETLLVLSGALLFALFGMVSTGLVAGVQLIYGRGDMELILSSPMPPRTVIAVRAVVIAASLLSLSALITWPFANIFALFGHPRFLVVYIAVPCLALVAASLSLALAHAVFRLLGPRRTRLMAQVLAGIIALAFALLPQIPGLLVEGEPHFGALAVLAARLPGPDSWIWLPARALQGEPAPLVGAILASLGLFWLTIRGLADGLIADAVKAAGTGAAAGAPRSGSRAFPGSALAILRRKEIYLLARDPWLLAKITSQMLFLVPIALLVWNAQGKEASPAWLLVVVLAGNLGGSFAWVTVSGEDAPDLLAAAPIRRRDVLRAKIEAALLAVAVVVATPLIVAAAHSPWLGVTLLVCCAGSALSGALISVLYPSPARRADFHQRGKGNAVVVTCEMLMSGAWALPGFLMLHRSLWAVPVALLLLALPALFKRLGSSLRKPRRTESRPA